MYSICSLVTVSVVECRAQASEFVMIDKYWDLKQFKRSLRVQMDQDRRLPEIVAFAGQHSSIARKQSWGPGPRLPTHRRVTLRRNEAETFP